MGEGKRARDEGWMREREDAGSERQTGNAAEESWNDDEDEEG